MKTKKLLLLVFAMSTALLPSRSFAGVKLDLGGFFRGYGVFADNDVTNENNFELRRDTELHATGETALDNGLTVGFHTEVKLASGPRTTAYPNLVDTDEVYAYTSGTWGRINAGLEDGAAYLLQVAAPSADSNVDGMRPYISGLNPSFTTGGALVTIHEIGYAHADFGGPGPSGADSGTDRVTYLTPKIGGFQAGFSYAPQNGVTTGISALSGSTADRWKNLWEASARYDGSYKQFDVSLGSGYSSSSVQTTSISSSIYSGIKTLNGGLSVAANGFTVGGGYKHSEVQLFAPGNNFALRVWVIGGAYDNGPWHVGASYLNTHADDDAKNVNETMTKHTVGGSYGFGPGMTLRSAVAWGEYDNKATSVSPDYTQITVGTDIQF